MPANGPPFNSIDDIPRGLTEEELDEVIAHRAAKRWVNDIKRLFGLDDD